MHKQPTPCVNKLSTVTICSVSITGLDTFYCELTGWEQVDSGDGSVSDGDQTFLSLDVDSCEVLEVIEECSVGGSHCEFDLGKLWQNSKESHLNL